MMLKQEVKNAMKKLGFSEYNIIVYETLLKEKELDARQLSQKTHVPYSRVYEVLNEMIEKGYIVKLDGRPSTYIPRSPIDVLQDIQSKQEHEFRTNSAIVKETLMNIYSEKRSAHNTQITITYGKNVIITHIKNLIKNAVRRLNIIIKDVDLILNDILDELKLLKLKHVKTKLIMPTNIQDDDRIKGLQDIGEFKFMKIPPWNFVLGDDKNAVLMTAGAYLKSVSEDIIGISAGHSATGFVLKELFTNLWLNL
ncbi:MAG: TrmB family transcriptional regulator [Promethearchaeota archaeon]